jgi:selenide, water dikinase
MIKQKLKASPVQYDLLKNIESGGCSAKLTPGRLDTLLKDIPFIKNKNLLVGADTSDDAAVYKINDETAIIQTVDFFPPMCADPYEFGQIAAVNALSDVFAMGGRAVLALNLVMFPDDEAGTDALKCILQGGAEKIAEAGAVLAGGHTIIDNVPKYGLAVSGMVHPDRIIANSGACAGDLLILTKPIGTGVILAGQKINETKQNDLSCAMDSMKQLNKQTAEIMQKYDIKCATDITGFGLLGHCREIAKGSGVVLDIFAEKIPLFPGAYGLIDMGCIPCAAFSNLKYIEQNTMFSEQLDYNLKMLACDAQTSGGILLCCPRSRAGDIVKELQDAGYCSTETIGDVRAVSEDRPYSITLT